MRRFYETWYRPERMAVIAVGDFDAEEIERTVTRNFGSLRGNPLQPRHPVPPWPAPPKNLRASVVTDPEATDTWIGFWYPLPNERFRFRADYRTALIASLWRTVLRERLEDVSEEAASPIISASTERRYLARPLGAEVVSVVVKKDRALDAVETVATEVERLARYGPTRHEIETRAATMLRYTRSITETGDGSSDLASELVDHFLTGNTPINNRMAYELVRDILPTIRLDDVTKFARALSIDSGALVIADATSNDAVAKATPADTLTET